MKLDLLFVFLFFAELRALATSTSGDVSVRINNCRGAKLKFKNSWTLSLDSHCQESQERILYEIISVTPHVAHKDPPPYLGIYEPYGRSGGTERYEMVLSDGRTFQLRRHREGKLCQWILQKGNQKYFRSHCSHPESSPPPRSGWKSVSSSTSEELIEVHQVLYRGDPYLVRKMNLKKYLSPASYPPPISATMESSITGDVTGPAVSDSLSQMLHPAVGHALGEAIHKRYVSREDRPIDSITIDGLFNHSLLASALEFEKVPLSKWVGPEAADYCCAGKYRLSFSHWNRKSDSYLYHMLTIPGSPWAKALQSLVSSAQFISFLESLTGIQNLIPMKVTQEELQWAGSNIIGVTSGGYLLIHNDFNTWNGLHRRVNVLLYLNKDWQPEWGGNLEIWDHNSTRCLHSIPPLFNRMSIFTVTDDAFHGHPEPLNSPPGVMRYGLQIVYYTRDKGPSYSSHNTLRRKRKYAPYHGAIFQPACPATSEMREFCAQHPRDSYELRCECNSREE